MQVRRSSLVTVLLGLVIIVPSLPASAESGPSPTPPPSGSDTGPSSEQIATISVAGGSIILPASGAVVTSVSSKSAAHTLEYGLQTPTRLTVCTDCVGGETGSLGSFASDTELVFYLTDRTAGATFVNTDPAHARVDQTGSTWTIFWDDAQGDGDFNDLITTVSLGGVPTGQTFGPCPDADSSGEATHGENPSACLRDPVNSATGAFTNSVRDLFLPGVGIPFSFARSYTSADTTSGPLGQGWTHSLNASLQTQPGGDVLVRTETGQQLLYGLRPDCTFAPPVGGRSTLAATYAQTDYRAEVLTDNPKAYYRLNDPEAGDLHMSQPISVEAWVYRTANITTSPSIISGHWPGAGNNVAWTLGALDSNRPFFGFFSDGSWRRAVAATELPLNAWAHLLGAYDGSSVKIYLNGTLDASVAETAPLPGVPDKRFYIGKRWDLEQRWPGRIDELAVYHAALGSARVTAHYNAPDLASFRAEVATDGPLSRWTMDDAAGTSLADDVGGRNAALTGTYQLGAVGRYAGSSSVDLGGTGFATIADGANGLRTLTDETANALHGAYDGPVDWRVDGIAGASNNKAVDFLGEGNGRITSAGLNLPAPVSVEAWVYRTGDMGGRSVGVFGNEYNGSSVRYALHVDDGAGNGNRMAWGFFSAGSWKRVFDPQVVPLNSWTHFVGTYDGASLRLYRNGIEVASAARTEALPAGSSTYYLGRRWDAVGERWWVGRIDEVAVYPSALTPARIQAHYGAGTCGAVTGYELTTTDQRRLRFNASGRLTRIEDRNGQGLTLSYDPDGGLAQVTDSVGRPITLTHNAAGLLTQVALPDGRSVTYAYTSGRLSSVTDLRGGVTTYTYDAAGRLAKIVDQNNHTVVENVYGTDGRVTSQTNGRGNVSTFSWDAATQTATMTDARGKVWSDVYASNVLIRRVDPLGNTTRFSYDADLNLAKITDPRGNATTFTYDARGNMLTKTDSAPLSYLTTYTYNARNDVTSIIDPRNNTTTYGYDASGNLTSITRPGNILTQYGRDPSGTGLLTSITDPRNKTTLFDYDAQGNLTSITDPLGNLTTMGYDASGRITSTVDPRGNVVGQNPADFTWTFGRNAANLPTSQTDPLGNTTTWAYDPAGNLTSRTDANNHTVSWSYDGNRNLTSVTAPGSIVTSYGYDPNNNLTSRTDANNHTWTYAYDDANRLSSMTSPLNRNWGYAYDQNGNLTTKTLPSGSITYSYDGINRVTAISYSNAPTTPNVTFGYDPNSNRTSMTDGQGSVAFTYDALNRLTGATRGSDSFSWGYDAASNLTSRTYPGNFTTTYAYDDANRLSSVVANGATTTYSYDAAGNLTTDTLPSSTGFTVTRTYDRAGRLTQVKNQKTGQSPLSQFTYTLDGVGNPSQIVTPTETITFAYDALDRLTQVCFKPNCTGSGLAGYDYTYDGVGNRLTQVRRSTSNTTTTYTYNADDQLTAAGSTTYTYTVNGNQASAGARTFTYDLENRLLTTTQGNTTHTYSYDGDGNRLKDSWGSNASSKVNYLWDVSGSLPQLAIERDGNAALLRRYTYGTRLLAESTTGTNAFYYLDDTLDSTANLVDSAGSTKWTYTYEPFGATRSAVSGQGAPTNLMRFNGQLIDTATGLYDLRTRMYDPALGRFLQFDPLAPTRLEPYAGSYVYVIDRPTVFTDPSGLCFIGLFGDDCDNPIHTAVQKVTEVGKVIYKGVKGCIKGLPYGVLGGGAVGGAIGGFSGPEGVGPGAAAGAVVGGTASCAAGAAYEIYKPPLSPDIPPLAYESAAGLLYASPVGYSEK